MFCFIFSNLVYVLYACNGEVSSKPFYFSSPDKVACGARIRVSWRRGEKGERHIKRRGACRCRKTHGALAVVRIRVTMTYKPSRLNARG